MEEIHFVQTSFTGGYEILKGYKDTRFFWRVLYHHENYDGSGYPDNLSGEAIPLGARIIRVCDVYAALTSDRPYRQAFESQSAMELMIEEIKDFDVKVFLAFQKNDSQNKEKGDYIMALKKKPVTGMKDILPAEMAIRDYVIRLIKETYGTFGFSSIETPCVEHIENLSSKQGGENEKLIFKILKRGEKIETGDC